MWQGLTQLPCEGEGSSVVGSCTALPGSLLFYHTTYCRTSNNRIIISIVTKKKVSNCSSIPGNMSEIITKDKRVTTAKISNVHTESLSRSNAI